MAELKANLESIKVGTPVNPYLTVGIATVAIIGSIFLMNENWKDSAKTDIRAAASKMDTL